MVDALTVLALALVVLGVVGTVVPLVPGALLSLAGVYLYWWHTGDPGTVALIGFTVVGVSAVVLDYVGGAVSARVSGATTMTTFAAALVTLPLLLVFGPLGVLIGVTGTVFAFEYRRSGDRDESLRTAALTTAGMLASTAVQVLLTGGILLAFLVVVFA